MCFFVYETFLDFLYISEQVVAALQRGDHQGCTWIPNRDRVKLIAQQLGHKHDEMGLNVHFDLFSY